MEEYDPKDYLETRTRLENKEPIPIPQKAGDEFFRAQIKRLNRLRGKEKNRDLSDVVHLLALAIKVGYDLTYIGYECGKELKEYGIPL